MSLPNSPPLSHSLCFSYEMNMSVMKKAIQERPMVKNKAVRKFRSVIRFLPYGITEYATMLVTLSRKTSLSVIRYKNDVLCDFCQISGFMLYLF